MKNKNAKYDELWGSLPEIIFELDAKGTIVYINSKGMQVAGYGNNEIHGMLFQKLINPKFYSEFEDSFAKILNTNIHAVHEWELLTKDGRSIPIRFSANAVENDGKITGIKGIIIDISKRKVLENKLRKSEERIRWFSDMAREGIAIYLKGKFIDANNACYQIFGYKEENFLQRDVFEFVQEEFHQIIKNYIDNDINDTPCEIKIINNDGEVIDVEFTSKLYLYEGEKNYIFLFNDISHRKQYEYLQEHDELTNLLNFRGFSIRLNEELLTAQNKGLKLAIITIRVYQDEFNVIKDISPDMERVLLKAVPMEICERLKSILFNVDTIARSGENEYMTMHPLPQTNVVNNTVKLLNKILNEFSQSFVKGIQLIARIGVTFFPDDFDVINPNKIISNSRYACDEAIFQKKEYMFYDEKSHHDTRERIEFIKDLIVAVKEEKCKNFLLHYQPKVDRDLKIVGIEALIRWQNSKWSTNDSGLVPPNKFIQVAEEIGLIGEIGKWVLFEACRQTKEWQEKNANYNNLQIAVNVSPSQLNDDLIGYVDYVLKETGLDPKFLELEITERESVKEKNAKILEKIRKKHISIAIDDFGIDYSSLSKLPKLAIDTIKLDKSYIDNIANDNDYENLVNHTIKMVHGLKYKVVAEGVEVKEQADKLFNEMDCDKIQGFYFYKPLSAREIEEKLNEPVAD